MFLLLVWIGMVLISAVVFDFLCVLFGNHEAVHAIVPQAPTVILRPAALEHAQDNTGLMQKFRRLARGDGPETRSKIA